MRFIFEVALVEVIKGRVLFARISTQGRQQIQIAETIVFSEIAYELLRPAAIVARLESRIGDIDLFDSGDGYNDQPDPVPVAQLPDVV